MNKFYKKITKSFQEIPIEIQRFYKKKYPDFVTKNNIKILGGQVPVFMFHSVDHFTFKAQLEFLKTNGYQTLDLKTFMAFLQGEIELKEPAVLLTFDDGEKSWYEIAYPLLKQYEFHAVGFVVPYYIKDKPEVANGKGWLSWPELLEMEQSGIFEFESHSFYHAQIFIEPKLVDFFNPNYSTNSWRLDIPWIEDNGTYTNQLKWGTPIYSSAPRLAAFPRYIDNEEIRNTCISWVEYQGSKDFFNRDNWRKELNKIYQSVCEKASFVKYESQEQTENKILEDLVNAKNVLSKRLNKPIKHLCYPWGISSNLGVSLSKKAGYSSNFWVSIEQRNTNQKRDDPYYIPRIKDDYLFRLPGKGRKYLWKIFHEKLIRRAAKFDIY